MNAVKIFTLSMPYFNMLESVGRTVLLNEPGDLRLRNGTEADLVLIGGPSGDGL